MNCRMSSPMVRTLLLSTAVLLAGCSLLAQTIPDRSATLVTDNASILSFSERQRLERKLVAYNDSTSIQIAVYTEPSLNGQDDYSRALDIAEAWGIGQAETDNGILVYVALNDRKIRIVTGYGAEGFLPDALAFRIIDQVMQPAFRRADYFGGLNQATDIIMQLGSGEYSAQPGRPGQVNKDAAGSGFLLLILLVVLIIVISRSNRGGGDGGYGGGGRYRHGRSGFIFFGPGSFGGGGGFSGGGGGFGGGGFGGFGGGSFGGGGAGGSW